MSVNRGCERCLHITVSPGLSPCSECITQSPNNSKYEPCDVCGDDSGRHVSIYSNTSFSVHVNAGEEKEAVIEFSNPSGSYYASFAINFCPKCGRRL